MKFLYVAFPKTGTQSINKTLEDKIISKAHYIPYEIDKFDQYISFVSIRDPLNYYISMYKYKIDSKDKIKNYGIMPNNTFIDFINDYVMCNNLEKWEKPWMNNYRQKLIKKYIQGKNLNIGYFTILFIFYAFKDPETILKQPNIIEYLENNEPDVNHIIRLEHLTSDYENLIANNNFPKIDIFCHVNKSKNLNIMKNDYNYLKKYDNFIYQKYYNL